MINQICIQFFPTKYGELILGSFDNRLCLCDWRYRKSRKKIDERIKVFHKADFVEIDSVIIQKAKKQLLEYFNSKRQHFDLDLSLAGTDFQIEVWNLLKDIPFGSTISYLELSRELGNELSIRAVASANGANALSIIIPCHRVIGSAGELTGYAGGLSTKKKLLNLENSLTQLELF